MDLHKHIYSHCISPKKVRVWSAYHGQFVYKELPCGNCIHCRNQRVNEWVTRLYAQAKTSQYVYYISLDYAPFNLENSTSAQLAAETAACYHNINKYEKYGLQPILLCRNHFDDFHKRLRKNTKIKYQYFGCGEYGSAYSRPHFHIVIFSNQEMTLEDFEKAWTINGYKIGRVDFADLVANGTMSGSSKVLNQGFVFRYVCKYIQKDSQSINNLKTLHFHEIYFKSLQKYIKNSDELFPEVAEITDTKVLDENWREYCKTYAPFVACSRRPAIGFTYLQENLQRFAAADFRLFGLSKECDTFPRYFMRKAKELCCRFVSLGSVSQEPATGSRMPYIKTLLSHMYNTRVDIESWTNDSAPVWCADKKHLYYHSTGQSKERITDRMPLSDFNFYDLKENIYYIFNGYDYTAWCKLKNKSYINLGKIDIIDIIHLIENDVDNLYKLFIEPFHRLSVKNEDKLYQKIHEKYDDVEKFKTALWQEYSLELARMRKKDIIIENSHLKY